MGDLAEKFDWLPALFALTILQSLIGGSLWYAVYLRGLSPETISNTVAGIFLSIPGWQLILPLAMFLCVVFVLGPVYALWKHSHQLKRMGVEAHPAWLAVGALGVQFWPLTWLAVFAHYHTRLKRYGAGHGDC